MLNVSSTPILTITLRNNLLEFIPLEKWYGHTAIGKKLFDNSRLSKGIWSIIITIPVLVLVVFVRDP